VETRSLFRFLNMGENKDVDIMITSRIQDISPKFTQLSLETFSLEDAMDYIHKAWLKDRDFTKKEKILAKSLAELLHCFPLVLAQAMAYINVTWANPKSDASDALQKFINLYKKSALGRKALLNWHGGIEKDIYETTQWDMWHIQSKKLNKKTLELIRICAFFSADDIPLELIDLHVKLEFTGGM